MRIAVIACSSYAASEKLSELSSAEADVDLLGQRLSEPDAGFVVHSFRAERGLAEAVDQVLAEAPEPVEEFLFYFAGYAVLNDERGPALLLDGERLSAFSLKRLRRVLGERARRSLAVLDTVPAFDGQMSPHDAVQTLATALADPTSGVHLLASARPESTAFARSPFASLFELVLDWQSVSGSPVRIDGLYAAMRAEEALFAEVPAAEYFPGSEPFELLRPAPTPFWSEPPSFSDLSSPSAERASGPEALPPDEITPVRAHEPLARGEAPSAAEAEPPSAALAEAPSAAEAEPPSTALAEAPSVAEATAPSVAEGAPPPPVRGGPPPLPKRAPSEPPPPIPATPADERELALEKLTQAMADGHHAEAVEHARAALRVEPRDPETYRTLHMLFEKLGRPDGCWNVACVLDATGAADVNESLIAGLHRPEGLLAANRVLDDYEWQKQKLLYPERDTTLDALFTSLGDALVQVGVETAQRKRRIPVLAPESEQDPAKSTTTLARTLLWTARLLGVPTPKLYVADGSPGELGIAGTLERVAIASKALGSGLSLPELAFLWARRLVLLRPEHRVVTFLPNAAELEDFVRASQALGASSERFLKRLDGDAKLFSRGLKRHLRGVDRGPFEAAAKAVSRRKIGASVAEYRRSVELTSGRAGLLACGDLSLALRLTERFPQHGALPPDEQSADLLTYSVSDAYAALRERLGVAVKA